MQKITPMLWFNFNAEEAMKFYTSIFKESSMECLSKWGPDGPGPEGSLLVGKFTIHGQELMVLNGGPEFKFTEAISFVIDCKNQEEVDYFWDKLSEGGKSGYCGWTTDKFGLSWQVVPSILSQLMMSADSKKAAGVMRAMMQMTKLDVAGLQRGYDEA